MTKFSTIQPYTPPQIAESASSSELSSSAAAAAAATLSAPKSVQSKTSVPVWGSAKFDFEIEHLQRGTDDAGEPHRIYFELFVAPEGTSTHDVLTGKPLAVSGISGSVLVGVGSISALDVLLVSNQIMQGVRVEQPLRRKMSLESMNTKGWNSKHPTPFSQTSACMCKLVYVCEIHHQ